MLNKRRFARPSVPDYPEVFALFKLEVNVFDCDMFKGRVDAIYVSQLFGLEYWQW